MQYLSIYSSKGERITSFVTGVHGETAEELKERAKKEYPDDVSVLQTESEYNEAMKGDLLYIGGKYSKRPEPTEEEKRESELAALDSKYAEKISAIEGDFNPRTSCEVRHLLFRCFRCLLLFQSTHLV